MSSPTNLAGDDGAEDKSFVDQTILDQFDPLSSKNQTEDETKLKTSKNQKMQEDEESSDGVQSEKHGLKSQSKPVRESGSDSEEDRPFDFQWFLSQLRHKSADPIARYLKSFLNEFNKKSWTTAEQVKIIIDFKNFIAGKMATCPPFSAMSPPEMSNALEGMEKLIMNRLYTKTFSPVIPPPLRSDDHEEDVLRDAVLEEKMRIWHWIEGRHLDLADRFLRNGEAFVKLASDELSKINHYRAPRDKVICILNCCKVIFGLLRQTNSEESADGFLPILIYVVIKARPKDLISNVNYVQRFRNPDRLHGETGYYLSSLIGAISFVESLDRSGLSISNEEFERNVEQSVRKIAEPIIKTDEAKIKKSGNTAAMNLIDDHPPFTPDRVQTPSTDVTSTTATGMNASSVLLNSAGLLSAPFKSISKLFETVESSNEGPKEEEQKDSKVSPQELAARQASAEEHEARRISEMEFESVASTLGQMFPLLDREVIRDVLREKQGRVGAAVDACLALVGT